MLEETGVTASIVKYVEKASILFNVPEDTVEKDVHWYLMMADSYYSKPQREEYFIDSGYYKFHEAYHLLKFSNEKAILEKAYNEYLELKKKNLWGNKNISDWNGAIVFACKGPFPQTEGTENGMVPETVYRQDHGKKKKEDR